MFEILDAPVEVRNAPDARPVERLRGEVKFENVSFAYDAASPVVRDIDLEVKPGK